MPGPITFAALPDGDNPASLLDTMFAWLSGFTVIPCATIGRDQIQLTPYADAPVVTAYTDLSPVFAFVASETNDGEVTINVAGLGALTAFKQNGTALVVAGDLVAGAVYHATFVASLQGGAGGFVLDAGGTGTPPTPPTPPWPPLPIPGGNSMPTNMIFFTANGTYTPSAGMVSVIVECAGGGGGGGGAFANGSHAGGAGGSGGYSRALLAATDVGANQQILIGAGGSPGTTGNGGNGGVTSFGNLCVANGGLGGQGDDAVSLFGQAGAGAAPGTVLAGRGMALPGNGGFAGIATVAPFAAAWSSPGGAIWGGAAQQVVQGGGNQPGAAGQAGAGGNGAISNGTTNVWVAGGAGGAGWCLVTEYS